MLPIRILTTTAILILLAAAGRAQTPTFARADYPTSDAPRGIATGDFNRDGAMDLALVNTGRKSVVVLMNEIGQGRGLVQRYEIVLGGDRSRSQPETSTMTPCSISSSRTPT